MVNRSMKHDNAEDLYVSRPCQACPSVSVKKNGTPGGEFAPNFYKLAAEDGIATEDPAESVSMFTNQLPGGAGKGRNHAPPHACFYKDRHAAT